MGDISIRQRRIYGDWPEKNETNRDCSYAWSIDVLISDYISLCAVLLYLMWVSGIYPVFDVNITPNITLH